MVNVEHRHFSKEEYLVTKNGFLPMYYGLLHRLQIQAITTLMLSWWS